MQAFRPVNIITQSHDQDCYQKNVITFRNGTEDYYEDDSTDMPEECSPSARMRHRLRHYSKGSDGEDNDGVFWMSFRDFCTHFRSIYVCRLFDTVEEGGKWHSYQVRAKWALVAHRYGDVCTAGGAPTAKNPDACYNPQWKIKVKRQAAASSMCAFFSSLSLPRPPASPVSISLSHTLFLSRGWASSPFLVLASFTPAQAAHQPLYYANAAARRRVRQQPARGCLPAEQARQARGDRGQEGHRRLQPPLYQRAHRVVRGQRLTAGKRRLHPLRMHAQAEPGREVYDQGGGASRSASRVH